LRCQCADAESQNEKIKRIQRPSQKTSDECIPLHWRQPPKVFDKFHEDADSVPSCNFVTFVAKRFCLAGLRFPAAECFSRKAQRMLA
jgi:hypothetical protein